MKDLAMTNIFSLANVDAQKVLDSLEDEEISGVGESQSRKRKRLEELTTEERMIRRKLKNRVAAQTARDRKKERLDNLEKAVGKLEKENEELKKCNEELRVSMDYLIQQNTLLRKRFKLDDGSDDMIIDHDYSTVSNVASDTKQIVIKEEEGDETKHASLRISLPQKFQCLLVSLIMTWLANPRMNNILTSMDKSHQEKFIKKLLHQKLRAKMMERSQVMSKAFQKLLKADLTPYLEICQRKIQMKSLNFMATSNHWWGKETIL